MRPSIFCGLFFAVGCGIADRPTPTPAQLEIENHQIDLGEVFLQPEDRQVDVPLKNVGERVLHVSELTPSCTCTKIVLDRAVIPPAEQALLSILLTVNEPGRHSASITIGSDSDEENSQVVAVYWTGVAPIECETPAVDFGNVLPGQVVERIVRFTRRNSQSRFVSLIPLADELKVGEIHNHEEFIDAPLMLTAGERCGQRSAQMSLKVENGWPEELPVAIRWNVREFFEANPNKLFLGSVQRGTKVRRRVVVSSLDGTEVKIDELDMTPNRDSMTLSQRAIGSGHVALDLDWMAPAESGVFHRQIRIKLDAMPPRDLSVEVMGYVIEPEPQESNHDKPKERNSNE